MRSHSVFRVLLLTAACAALPVSAQTVAAGTAEPDYAACLAHVKEVHADASLPARREAMVREIEAYQTAVEEALGQRAEAIKLYQKLQLKSAAREPLSNADLRMLNEGTAAMLAQRQVLLNMAIRHECWAAGAPNDDAQEAALQVAGVAMSLSAALVLYDNYQAAVAPYRADFELRRHLNSADKGFNRNAGMLDELHLSFNSAENRQRMRRAIAWLQQYQGMADPAALPGYRYLQALIEQSPSLAMLRKNQPVNALFGGIGFFGGVAIDGLFSLKNESSNFSSLLFGNAIGLVETRRGKLYNQPAVTERVGGILRAGDILLEKTPFRLTDTFIPGHWGHAAVWVGSETDLRALGIWDHAVVKPHQDAIRAGRGVVEALRSGVEMNTMAHFLNVDDLGVLRHEKLSDEKRAEVVLLALRQVGKAYDFNFDAETTNRVFCSKLVYLAYGDLQWPTSRILGRVTVSPDNIAARASQDGPLTVALLYHDGQEITEDARAYMQRLMQPTRLAGK